MSGGRKMKVLYCFLFMFLVFCSAGFAQEVRLAGYPTIDQNQMTYRTYSACLATQVAHGASYTRCIVDSKLGGTTGFGYNCGARAFTEIIGYWANNEFPGLMIAPPTGDVPDYSEQMLALFDTAGVEFTTYGDCSSTYGCHNCDTGLTAYSDHYKTVKTSLVTKVAEYFVAKGYFATDPV